MSKQQFLSKNKSLRGWRDILPDEQKWWNFVRYKVEDLAQDYGYQKIDLPHFVYSKIYGNLKITPDYIDQNLVQIQNQGRDRISLRNDLIVPLVQAYVKHSMHNLPHPLKIHSNGPVFNFDSTCQGNCRQVHAFSFSLLGDFDPSHDAQSIYIAYNFIKDLFSDIEIEINSIGCKTCQTAYAKKLVNFTKQSPPSYYCKACQNLLLTNPLRILDCPSEKCVTSLLEAPQIIDGLCNDCKERFVKVLEDLDDLDISYNLNPKLAPSQPYWSQTVFAITRTNQAGNKVKLLEGGRQDDVFLSFGKSDAGLISFSGFYEDLAAGIKEIGTHLPEYKQVDVFVARLGDDAKKKSFKLFNDLRSSQVKVRESFAKNGLKGQLENAIKVGAKYSLIIGQKEIIDSTVILRDMESGIQEIISFDKIIQEVKKRLHVQNSISVTSYHQPDSGLQSSAV